MRREIKTAHEGRKRKKGYRETGFKRKTLKRQQPHEVTERDKETKDEKETHGTKRTKKNERYIYSTLKRQRGKKAATGTNRKRQRGAE